MSTRTDILELERAAWRNLSPWDGFEMTDERVFELADRVAVVTYRAKARRSGEEYEALFNSTYLLRDGVWKLALHQQTPVQRPFATDHAPAGRLGAASNG